MTMVFMLMTMKMALTGGLAAEEGQSVTFKTMLILDTMTGIISMMMTLMIMILMVIMLVTMKMTMTGGLGAEEGQSVRCELNTRATLMF